MKVFVLVTEYYENGKLTGYKVTETFSKASAAFDAVADLEKTQERVARRYEELYGEKLSETKYTVRESYLD